MLMFWKYFLFVLRVFMKQMCYIFENMLTFEHVMLNVWTVYVFVFIFVEHYMLNVWKYIVFFENVIFFDAYVQYLFLFEKICYIFENNMLFFWKFHVDVLKKSCNIFEKIHENGTKFLKNRPLIPSWSALGTLLAPRYPKSDTKSRI